MFDAADAGVYPSKMPVPEDALPRCCARHPDWATLTQHIIDDFPGIAIGDVVREVGRAKDAVEQVALSLEESLEIGELIVRHQLMMRAGQAREAARLDPETHVRAM